MPKVDNASVQGCDDVRQYQSHPLSLGTGTSSGALWQSCKFASEPLVSIPSRDIENGAHTNAFGIGAKSKLEPYGFPAA